MLMITCKKKKKADEYSVTPVKTCPQILSFFGHKRVKMFLYVPTAHLFKTLKPKFSHSLQINSFYKPRKSVP